MACHTRACYDVGSFIEVHIADMHRIVLANKTVCKLLKQASNGYHRVIYSKELFLFICLLTP